jgi:creatinine amidohydrolase
MGDAPLELAALSTTALAAFVRSPHPVILWPVGSTEPHGPHLPLATDVILAAENARRAAFVLRARGVAALVAPALPYGVTDFAAGFAGAVSVPAEALVSLLVAGADAFRRDGFRHVCLINHHLEPGQLDALSQARDRIAAKHGAASVSLPQVVSPRWGRRLGDEFRSGACHAGRYESSLVLAAAPNAVDEGAAVSLEALPVSLSRAIRGGAHTFLECGMTQAYTGDPASATAEEGHELYEILAEMVVTEVCEALGLATECS